MEGNLWLHNFQMFCLLGTSFCQKNNYQCSKIRLGCKTSKISKKDIIVFRHCPIKMRLDVIDFTISSIKLHNMNKVQRITPKCFLGKTIWNTTFHVHMFTVCCTKNIYHPPYLSILFFTSSKWQQFINLSEYGSKSCLCPFIHIDFDVFVVVHFASWLS